jgi:hypothetical protein
MTENMYKKHSFFSHANSLTNRLTSVIIKLTMCKGSTVQEPPDGFAVHCPLSPAYYCSPQRNLAANSRHKENFLSVFAFSAMFNWWSNINLTSQYAHKLCAVLP